MKHIKSAVSALLAATAVCSLTAQATQPYMDDSNMSPPVASGLPAISQHLYPRVHQHEMIGDSSATAVSKFDFVETKGIHFDATEKMQQLSPSTMVLRNISGREYQGYNQSDPCYISSGIAFAGTGPVSQGGPRAAGCNIYAGHWLYKAGSPLNAPVDAGTATLYVADASRFTAGQYVVIYDAPAGSFRNPEHVLVTGRDLARNTLTLGPRGYKSSASAHAAGSIVAQHVQGQGNDNRLWALNFSTRSPKDGNGKTWGDFYATWLASNYKKHKDGRTTTTNLAGIMLDTDFYYELVKKETDTNNDLVTDSGRGSDGSNWLGDGLDLFYGMVTQRAPDVYLLSGVQDGRGYQSAEGNQMESWPDYGNGDFNPNPKYMQLNSLFAMYLFNTGARTRGEPLVINLMKTPTHLYPGNASPVPADNRAFRMAFTLTLMENGFFGTHSRYTPDAWWDEFAVDVKANSPTYGTAIVKSDLNSIYQNRGWLGKPIGKFTRIYSDVDNAAGNSLLANGNFDTSIDGWSGVNVNVARTTATAMDGGSSMLISMMSGYQQACYGARVRSGAIALTGGQGYTLAFSAKAEKYREIVVSIGSENSVRIPVGPNWRRYVIGFNQKQTTSSRVIFQVGKEDSQVWLDSVYAFKGNSDVFRRDFDHGIALTNATPETRTIALGGLFRRIKGAQDPAINNGQSVTAVTLAPYDGVVLVRPPN